MVVVIITRGCSQEENNLQFVAKQIKCLITIKSAPTCSWSSATRALLKGDAPVTRALKWALAVILLRPPLKTRAQSVPCTLPGHVFRCVVHNTKSHFICSGSDRARVYTPPPLWPRARWEWTWTAFSAALNIHLIDAAPRASSPCDDEFLSVICEKTRSERSRRSPFSCKAKWCI